MSYEERAEKAMELFSQGYNCAQSVVGAWADHYGMDIDTALRISSSFGGGIGRMRLTCGAASGMFMLAGLQTGTTDPKNREAKAHNYEVVQHLAAEFKKEMGSINCGELLAMAQANGAEEGSKNSMDKSPVPEERTPEYYRKRPCREIVGCASRIFARYLDAERPE
ncbi:MAG: C_GCAxxG_C_C family protein [Bacteroidaceae bacterium]|nr:C_GCAxxG_C_C family protein [Bacteroidaceae bacterium]